MLAPALRSQRWNRYSVSWSKLRSTASRKLVSPSSRTTFRLVTFASFTSSAL
jgi:hypothetical protein